VLIANLQSSMQLPDETEHANSGSLQQEWRQIEIRNKASNKRLLMIQQSEQPVGVWRTSQRDGERSLCVEA
jgi:hypothetical protein